ncbi:hypothetical protein HMPREF1870_00106 [Bacteroidales bacterium KA00344]|nr:hypothetical protein HMPREF1870_00106 [Bacteroidales bacterium KA00344]
MLHRKLFIFFFLRLFSDKNTINILTFAYHPINGEVCPSEKLYVSHTLMLLFIKDNRMRTTHPAAHKTT